MAIIISTNGKNARKLEPSGFALEDRLQQYIYDNPESVPVYDIREDIRLLILAREFPTNSGPIDTIGVDQDGTIYVIETKLFKNPDKRQVLAQVLDYGASLWRHSTDFDAFTAVLDSKVTGKFGINLHEKLAAFFGVDEDGISAMLQNMRLNLASGNFKFVVLMDKLDDRLKDLIAFINRNSQFDVYAVELEYYKYDENEIIIPKLYGAEVKKEVQSTAASGARRVWTEDAFWDEVRKQSNPAQTNALQKLYAWAKSSADEITWGTGAQRGSFSPKYHKVSPRSFLTVFSDGKAQISYGYLDDDDDRLKLRDTLKRHFDLAGVTNADPASLAHAYPGVSADFLSTHSDKLMAAVDEFTADY